MWQMKALACHINAPADLHLLIPYHSSDYKQKKCEILIEIIDAW